MRYEPALELRSYVLHLKPTKPIETAKWTGLFSVLPLWNEPVTLVFGHPNDYTMEMHVHQVR